MTVFSVSRLGIAAAAVAGLALSAPDASADAKNGLAKSAICASCHGPVGVSPNPTFPNIAGQNPLYIQYALRRYRSGERGGEQAGMMYTVTQALSDTDIQDLAAYYGSLPPGRAYGTSMVAGDTSGGGDLLGGAGLRLRNDP